MKTRIENKYICSKTDKIIIESKLKLFTTSEKYTVNSLYFDDMNLSSFFDKEEGINNRKKFRIRRYNNLDKIYLEKKTKVSNLSSKNRIEISPNIYYKILELNLSLKDLNNNGKLLQEFYIEQKINLLRPQIIVSYDRISYFNKEKGYRITFDTNIAMKKDINTFFSDEKESALIGDNIIILEIKTKNKLPEHIQNIINNSNIQRVAYSKYYNAMMKKRGNYDI